MNTYFPTVAGLLATHASLVRETVVDGPHVGSERIKDADGTVLASLGTMEGTVLTEHLNAKPHLYVYGGGHVALAIYRMAVNGELPVDIFDERPEWGDPARFPLARVHQEPMAEVLSRPMTDKAAYALIMTHRYDQQCLAYALRQPFAYIGMIGSAAKKALAWDAMHRQGFTDADLATVHAPIGLPIGGDTPFEVAVSVMAEIVRHATGGHKHHLVVDPGMLEEAGRAPRGSVLVRVLENDGSSPATPGAVMVVEPDGFSGTIGGGMIEKTAIDTARTLTANLVRTYDLSVKGNLDMECGGKATLLYTVLNP